MPSDPEQLQQRQDFAVAAAREAGALILRYYQRSDLHVELKHDRSPVTRADRGAEELLRERIGQSYPQDGVLGEELGEKAGSNAYRWILDPVDGTKSFVHGVPLFGTLIGLEFEGRLVMGVCRFPALDEVVYATEGQGAWWKYGGEKPRRTQVTDVSQLSDALFCTTTIAGWEKVGRRAAFDRFVEAAGLTRGWGDCYGHILVATGRAEVMIDPELNEWDAAALVPIVHEAGGHFVDFAGQPTISSCNGLSVNAALKDQVLELLQD